MLTLTDDLRSVLTGDRLHVSAGCEVLNLDLTVAADVSDDFIGGSVARDMFARIHGTCRLDLSIELAWGQVLVRPYVTVSDGSVESRVNVGVFMLTTPETPLGTDPVIYTCEGFDRIYLLDREIGDDYTVASGTTYYAALTQVFADAGLAGVLIDGAAADFTLPVDRDWPLVAKSTDPDQTDTPVTWLRVVNDLLAAINFRGVWADQDGFYRCQQYLEPSVRAPEFTFDVDDASVTIVGADRKVIADQWKQPNRWVFLWKNRPGGMSDTEGDGKYTYELPDDDPMSATSRGLVWTRVFSYEAASQAVLESLGDRRVASDVRMVTTIQASTGPWPVAGHADVYGLVDAALPAVSKVIATRWELDLLGGDTTWAWEAVA